MKKSQQSLENETSASIPLSCDHHTLTLGHCTYGKCSQSSTCLQVMITGGGQDWEQGYAVSRLADSPFVEACVTLGRYRHADSTDSREVTLAG